MFVVAWALNQSVAPVPDNLLLMNVEALAGPDGGGGGGNEGQPDKPIQPEGEPCFRDFDYTKPSELVRKCDKSTPPQRSGDFDEECINDYSGYLPRSAEWCYYMTSPSHGQ